MSKKKILDNAKKLVQDKNKATLTQKEIDTLNASIAYFEELGNFDTLMDVFKKLHNHFNRENDVEQLLDLCYTFLPIAKRSKKYEDWGHICRKLSILHRIKAEYDKALDFIEQAQQAFEYVGNRYHLSAAYNSKANIYLERGEYSLSLQNYHISYEMVKNQEKTDMYYLSKLNLAAIYFILKFYDKALELYKQDLVQLSQNKNMREHYAAVLMGIAEVYSEQDRMRLSIKYAKKAILEWEKTTKIIGKANSYTVYGGILSKLGKHEDALLHFYQSLEMCQSYQHKRGILQNLSHMGKTYYELHDYKKSIESLENARDLAQEMNLNIELKKIYSTLHLAYEKVGKTAEAYNIMKQLIWLNDNYFNLNLQAKVNEVQVEFELEKKELAYSKERELAEYKNNLFSYLAHEFRTPLTLIKAPVELIKMETGIQSIQTNSEQIEIQIERMEKLLNQLLEINQLQEGKMPLNKKVGGILKLFKGIIKTYEKEAQIRKIRFQNKLPSKDIYLMYDEDKVEKIVSNLLSNALKYSQEYGRVFLGVSYAEGKMTIEVTDNGMGIPQKFHDDIFTKYYRIPSNENIPGSGLGLSFVKELVELMDGNIRLESTEGEGSSFFIEIPMEKIKEIRKNELNSKDKSGENSTDGKRIHLLIVEDNYEVLKLLQQVFKEEYKVSTALNGKDALKSIQKTLPDLIITDVMMPLMNGIELCNHLKKDERYSHIPIVILSAKSQLYDKIDGLESGADAYMTKPFSLEEIKKTVKNLILQRKIIIDKFSKSSLIFTDQEMISHEMMIIQEATDYIIKNLSNEHLSVNDLALHLNMSRFTLIRRFKTINNITPNNYIQKIRLEKAKEMIKNRVASMSEIAYKVGFASTTYFTSSFKKEFGLTPKEYSQLNG